MIFNMLVFLRIGKTYVYRFRREANGKIETEEAREVSCRGRSFKDLERIKCEAQVCSWQGGRTLCL